MAGKQAKIMTDANLKLALAICDSHRYPFRDKLMVLFTAKSGFRSKEVALIKWRMVLNSDGLVGDTIFLEDKSSKRGSGRSIPMNNDLQLALIAYKNWVDDLKRTFSEEDPVIISERSIKQSGTWAPMNPGSVVNFFGKLYRKAGLKGCSSHSGRRTFVTKSARNIIKVGGSLRDVQQLAGHKSLKTTQDYIEGDTEAKRKLMDLI